MDGWMDGWTDGRTDGGTDGRTDGWMDGWTDGRTDGRRDGWIVTIRGYGLVNGFKNYIYTPLGTISFTQTD
jgi:hypothetical protein